MRYGTAIEFKDMRETVKMMNIYDISVTIQEGMTVYKNKPEKQPHIRVVQDFSTATAHESRIDMDVHCGTHLDAPLHMVPGGSTIETIGLEQLVGPARVLDLTHVEDAIGVSDLTPFDIQPGEWLLFKTRNSLVEEFDFDFVYLNVEAAEYLGALGIRGVGTDALGIERAQAGHPTHKTLFKHGVLIVEGLRLKEVPGGRYFLVIAPLKLEGIDAAPARALLISDLEKGLA
jgi:arylformamidase